MRDECSMWGGGGGEGSMFCIRPGEDQHTLIGRQNRTIQMTIRTRCT